MEHHSNKEAMEAEHQEGESTMQAVHGAMHVNVNSFEPRQPKVAPPREPPTAAAPPPHVVTASPSSSPPAAASSPPSTTAPIASTPSSSSPIGRRKENATANPPPPQPVPSLSSVNQGSPVITSSQPRAIAAIPLSVVPQYSPSSSTSSSQDEEDLANNIEVQSHSSHDSNHGDKKTKPRTLVALARKRERERNQHEKNPSNSPSINSYPNVYANKLNVKRKLNFDYLPADLCSNVSGSSHGKYVIPQLRKPQVMMLKEIETKEEENPRNSTKIAYIHGKLQLTLETSDRIE